MGPKNFIAGHAAYDFQNCVSELVVLVVLLLLLQFNVHLVIVVFGASQIRTI